MQPLDPDAVGVVASGMPFPHAGFGERYIEAPSTTKRGFIVPVTKDAIFFDRTHMLLKNAAEVGEALGVNKEKRIAQLIAGITNNYKENGSSFNTYQTAAPRLCCPRSPPTGSVEAASNLSVSRSPVAGSSDSGKADKLWPRSPSLSNTIKGCSRSRSSAGNFIARVPYGVDAMRAEAQPFSIA